MKNYRSYVKMGIAAVLLIAVLLFVYNIAKPDTQEGSKQITVEVTDKAGETEVFVYQTDLEYLGELLRDEGLAAGEESVYGMFITEVNGQEADSSKQEWWCITKAGEFMMTNADETVIEDGDQYELTLKVGYEE